MDTFLRILACIGLFIFAVWVSDGNFNESAAIYIAGILTAIFINMRTVE